MCYIGLRKNGFVPPREERIAIISIFEAITGLLNYGEKEKLFESADRIFVCNSIIAALGMDSYEYAAPEREYTLKELLDAILAYACENGLCGDSVTERDLFDTHICGLLLPRPSEVISKFYTEYKSSPRAATEYYYNLSRKSDYIREYRIANDVKWVTDTEYGDIDITINLSKPEKDPKAIAAAAKAKSSSYPKCMLCKENEGYAGRLNHPARQNHRIIPITINNSQWFLQYSPYVYYNEHCIVLNAEHVPMVIDKAAFQKLFDFVKLFPHYFIGSNADLPIVGGSILAHEHFQGGNYTFAMAKAPVETALSFKGFEDISAGIVKWPMSVIRLSGKSTDRISELADKILTAWRSYSDESAGLLAYTDGTPHHTVTPIARMVNGEYQLDLVLRSNLCSEEYPDGIYHPHTEYHNIKKENIGLIEVMGLAVLPSRLKEEMRLVADSFKSGTPLENNEKIAKHASWFAAITASRKVTPENVDSVLRDEIGKTFACILENCGVYKRTTEGKAAFLKFTEALN